MSRLLDLAMPASVPVAKVGAVQCDIFPGSPDLNPTDNGLNLMKRQLSSDEIRVKILKKSSYYFVEKVINKRLRYFVGTIDNAINSESDIIGDVIQTNATVWGTEQDAACSFLYVYHGISLVIYTTFSKEFYTRSFLEKNVYCCTIFNLIFRFEVIYSENVHVLFIFLAWKTWDFLMLCVLCSLK